MDQPESTNIQQHPGFANISEADQKEVTARYEAVYVSSQRLGVKIAQGMAYEAAKKLLESKPLIEASSEDYGVHKQATVPKTHSIDTSGCSGDSPSDNAEPAGHKNAKQADPEDDGAKKQQVDNHVAKDGSGKIDEGKAHGFDDIEHGDTVHYNTPQGQKRSGTAHIRGDGGTHWVLRNNSKTGGSGSLVDKKNFHSVTKRGRKLSPSAHLLVYGSGGKSKNEEYDVIDLAAGYITRRAETGGLMEANQKFDKYTDFHGTLEKAGFKHKGSSSSGKKGPEFHNYDHPDGHSMSVSVNTSGETGPYGAKKKGHVNGFFLSHHPHDGEVKGGTTIADFQKHHKS